MECLNVRIRVPESLRRKKVYIFDIDGTLVDASRRYLICLEEAKLLLRGSLAKLAQSERAIFQRLFLSDKYLHLDVPNVSLINTVNVLFKADNGIVILTGRPERMREATVKQLKELGVPYDLLIMRPNNCRISESKFKILVVGCLIKEGLRIVEVYDDNPEVIEAVKATYGGVKTVICRCPGGYSLLL